MSAQLKEAQAHLDVAEKFMKTSFFKRTPDYESASDEFDRAGWSIIIPYSIVDFSPIAGTLFKVARDYDKAIYSYIQAGRAYEATKTLFHSAKVSSSTFLNAILEKLPFWGWTVFRSAICINT